MNETTTHITVVVYNIGACCPRCGIRLRVARTMPPTDSGVIVRYYKPCVCGWRGKSASVEGGSVNAE